MSSTLRIVSRPRATPPTAAAACRIRGGSTSRTRDAEEQLDRDAHQRGGGELVDLAGKGQGEVDDQERDRGEASRGDGGMTCDPQRRPVSGTGSSAATSIRC